jgi:hypothetical protein
MFNADANKFLPFGGSDALDIPGIPIDDARQETKHAKLAEKFARLPSDVS